MTRVITVSSDLWTAPQSNGGCGSYSIMSCAACAGRAVDEQLDEAQRHVDAARDARGGDEAAVQVLDDALGASAPRRARRARG